MIRRPAAILALLTALNLLNYLDRFLVAAVLEPMKRDLGFSDAAGGSLATVFLVGYFLTSPVFGALADRGSRKRLIALGVGVWSLATAASGLADGLTALLVARAFVGVGEASYATLAPTIIDDLAPPERKGRWLSVFFLATPVGSALGYVLGGLIAKTWGWKAAFFVAGGPGLLAAILCLFIVEPTRALAKTKESPFAAIEHFRTRALYRRGVLGYTAATFALGAFAFWGPAFITRTYGLPECTAAHAPGSPALEACMHDAAGKASFVFGLITVVGGLVGTLAGGAWADRRALRERAGAAADSGIEDPQDRRVVYANLWVCAVSSFLAAPIALGAFLMPSAKLFFVLVFFCEAFIFLGTSPVNAVLLRSVPDAARARGMALAIFAIHVAGDMWSPMLVGKISDMTDIRTGVMILPLAFAVSGFFWWVRPRRETAAGPEARARG